MALSVKSLTFLTVAAVIGGALYLAWSRAPALIVDLSSGIAAAFCL